MTRNYMDTKGFISYNPQDILVTEGTQGRHLEAGTEAEAMKDCCLLVCSQQPASYAIQTTRSGVAPPLSPPISIKKMSYGVLTGIWMEASSQLTTWACVKSTESYSHTRRQRQEGLPKFKASQKLLSKSLSQNKQTKAKKYVVADKCNVWTLIDHGLKKKNGWNLLGLKPVTNGLRCPLTYQSRCWPPGSPCIPQSLLQDLPD